MRKRVVIKVGGSLFDLPDLAARLDTLLSEHAPLRPLLIAGGGPAADVVRNWSRTFPLSEETSHGLAMESLSLTASLLMQLLPHSLIVSSVAEAEACWSHGERPVLRIVDWAKAAEERGSRVPHTWDVTSDSLAAWVARDWAADELWLLKSVNLPEGVNVETASRQGLVDGYFPTLAADLPRLRWCNLRSNRPQLQIWKTTGPA